MVTCPSGSQYCVATCPFSNRRSSQASLATKRPSPWDAGVTITSPGFTHCSQGERFDTTLVQTMREMCLPIVLKVSVGESSAWPLTKPFGTRPSLMSAWKPLQMPRASPSRSLRSFSISSRMRSFRNAVAKNLADPSGSSPAEKPPGNMMICASAIPLAYSSTEERMSSSVRLRNTLVVTAAPALSNALAESYSQFVPGKTGMKTRGCPILCEHTAIVPPSKSGLPTSDGSSAALLANTLSSLPVQAVRASCREMCTLP